MTNKHTLFIGALAIACLSGCLKTREQLRGEGGGQASNTPVAKQTTAQQRAEKSAQPVTPPPPAQRTQEEYDEQLRQLYGRVEAAEAKVQQMEQAAQNNQKDQALQQKLTAYEEEFKRLNEEVRLMSEQMTAMRAQATPAPVAPVAVKAGGASSDKVTPFDEGEAAFKDKKWKEAIVAYEKYRSTYPKGKNFLEATYKIGLSFSEIGMKEEARAFYEEVVAKAPKSKEAKKAQFRLKNVK